jgi:hypothetical protein
MGALMSLGAGGVPTPVDSGWWGREGRSKRCLSWLGGVAGVGCIAAGAGRCTAEYCCTAAGSVLPNLGAGDPAGLCPSFCSAEVPLLPRCMCRAGPAAAGLGASERYAAAHSPRNMQAELASVEGKDRTGFSDELGAVEKNALDQIRPGYHWRQWVSAGCLATSCLQMQRQPSLTVTSKKHAISTTYSADQILSHILNTTPKEPSSHPSVHGCW